MTMINLVASSLATVYTGELAMGYGAIIGTLAGLTFQKLKLRKI